SRRLPARPRLPVRPRGGSVPGSPRSDLRRRAEPRRAAPVAPLARDVRPEAEAPLGGGLRRLPPPGDPGGPGDHPPAEGGVVVSYIKKPVAKHPSLQPNKLGLTVRDYEGSMSTLCAGCGHDSITAAIIRAFYELDTPPHMVAKVSGIGCSSKTPTYFLSGAHGFNSAHGRMPAIVSGANAADRAHTYLGVSADGSSCVIRLRPLS